MPPQNGKSRQRCERIPIPVDDWLLERAAQNPNNPLSAVAHEINYFLLKAYKADMKKRQLRAERAANKKK